MNKKKDHFKSLIKIQFVIVYADSEILDPLGRMEHLTHSLDIDGQIIQPLPKKFILRMRLEAVEVRDSKSRSKKPLLISPLGFTTDLMDGEFHRPYTKAEIKKMRADEDAREKELEEIPDYDE